MKKLPGWTTKTYIALLCLFVSGYVAVIIGILITDSQKLNGIRHVLLGFLTFVSLSTLWINFLNLNRAVNNSMLAAGLAMKQSTESRETSGIAKSEIAKAGFRESHIEGTAKRNSPMERNSNPLSKNDLKRPSNSITASQKRASNFRHSAKLTDNKKNESMVNMGPFIGRGSPPSSPIATINTHISSVAPSSVSSRSNLQVRASKINSRKSRQRDAMIRTKRKITITIWIIPVVAIAGILIFLWLAIPIFHRSGKYSERVDANKDRFSLKNDAVAWIPILIGVFTQYYAYVRMPEWVYNCISTK